MKRMMLCGLALMLTASISVAEEGRALRSLLAPALFGQSSLVPMPAPLSSVPSPITPVPDPAYSSASGGPIIGQPVELFSDVFSDVRFRAVRNISPDAVPTIIQVADPCNKTNCCKNCVYIQVCMPPCDPKCVKVSRDGDAVRYDYGKYAVVARSVGDHIVVRYHD
jgi:hypothetical protein